MVEDLGKSVSDLASRTLRQRNSMLEHLLLTEPSASTLATVDGYPWTTFLLDAEGSAIAAVWCDMGLERITLRSLRYQMPVKDFYRYARCPSDADVAG